MTDDVARQISRHQISRHQSRFSDAGRFTAELEALPTDLAGLQRISSGLVFHYRAGGDWAENGVASERISEVDTRYADLMIERLLALRPGLTCERSKAERIVGCCRDSALLFVTMARHRGMAARARVGFAGYFTAGWWIDHTIAEVWDGTEERWRLVEPGVDPGRIDPTDGVALDVLDVDRRRFVTAPEAWRACRSGAADPERFVVDPAFPSPVQRSWPYLAHNLCLDLAALNGVELVLWDAYGYPSASPALAPADPLALGANELALSTDELALLDTLADTTARPDPSPAELGAWLERDAFRVPEVVTSYSPARDAAPARVALRT